MTQCIGLLKLTMDVKLLRRSVHIQAHRLPLYLLAYRLQLLTDQSSLYEICTYLSQNSLQLNNGEAMKSSQEVLQLKLSQGFTNYKMNVLSSIYKIWEKSHATCKNASFLLQIFPMAQGQSNMCKHGCQGFIDISSKKTQQRKHGQGDAPGDKALYKPTGTICVSKAR